MLRALLVSALVCVAAGAFSAPSFAARPGPLPHSVSSRHFVVHYTSDPNDAAYTYEREATTLAALGDRAYDAETGWGYPAPLDDGDGMVDVYIVDLSALPGVLAVATPDNPAAATSSGYIVFAVASLNSANEGETIAHELFHLIQFSTWANPSPSDAWLFEGSAEWAAAKVYNFPGSLASASGPSDLPLDCRDTFGGFDKCDPNAYLGGGYSRWPFFQALAARYGATFLESVLANGASGSSATQALVTAIGAQGGTLANVYNDWAVEQMAGGYGIPALDALVPKASATVATGINTSLLSTVTVPVDHLATRYVKFTRGDGAGDHACFAASLTITVTMPAVVTSQPYFYWNAKGSSPIALSLNGNTATTTVPWDTCLWSANAGYLALPNTTTDVDAADFVVASSLTVDPNTPASASSAPAQAPVYGGTTPVFDEDDAPSISVFGPLLLRVSSASPTLRLIVESSGEGILHVTLGTVELGMPTLRPGNNDLRFTLPKSLLSALRRSSAAGNVLTLTPFSTSGVTIGEAVTRTVSVTPAPQSVKKKKKK